MAERDDYFYCGQFDCPGEHPIPGMTCPDADEERRIELLNELTELLSPPIEVEEPDPQPLPDWCPDPSTCTNPMHYTLRA